MRGHDLRADTRGARSPPGCDWWKPRHRQEAPSRNDPFAVAVGAGAVIGAHPIARDVEEDVVHILPPVTLEERQRRALIDDETGTQHDHLVAHALDLATV